MQKDRAPKSFKGEFMNRRYLVFGLSVVLALALAVPALGGPGNPVASISASVKSIANKALKTAKSAKKAAKEANTAAAGAQTTANDAKATANDAKTAAGKAQTTANEAKTAAAGAQTTANEAKTAAAGAQTTANEAKTAAAGAQATADSKFGHTEETFAAPTAENTTATKSELIACPAGQTVTGGGYSIQGTANQVTVTLSESYFNSWDVSARAISGFTPTWGLTVAVQCAFP
jgi:type IV secretory pathway VirB10-like protein